MISPRQSLSTPFLSSFFVGHQVLTRSGSTVSSFSRYGPTLLFLLLLPTLSTTRTTQPILMSSSYVLFFTKSSPLQTSFPFQSPTPYWCWIGGGFDVERIVGEYLWLWTAALSSIFFYTLLFFRLRGNIQVDPQDWKRIRIRLHPRSRVADDPFLDAPFTTACREAMTMIWYPICYTILVLPLSVVRWRIFRQQNVQTPYAVTAVVVTIFGLSGVTNVALIMLTRRNLLLFGERRGVVSTQESRDISAGRFRPGLTLSEHGRALVRSRGSTGGGRAATPSPASATFPRVSLGRSGGLDLKSIMAAGSNWEDTSTHHTPSIALRSVASSSDPMKPFATPAPPPASYGDPIGKRKSLLGFERGRTTSGSSIRAWSSPDEREQGGDSDQPLDEGDMVGMVRRRSLAPEAQMWQMWWSTSPALDQGESVQKGSS